MKKTELNETVLSLSKGSNVECSSNNQRRVHEA